MDSNNNSANMKLSPGMMCLVIGAVKNLSNIGKTVIAVRCINEGEFIPELEACAARCSWLVEGESLVSTTASGIVSVGRFSLSGYNYLMPIRPEEDPLEITDAIVKKEKA